MSGRGNPKGVGRPKGRRNRLTVEVKAALETVFEERGGTAGLKAWSDQDPGAFYQLWGRLLPKELKANERPGEIRVFVHRDGDSQHMRDRVETA